MNLLNFWMRTCWCCLSCRRSTTNAASCSLRERVGSVRGDDRSADGWDWRPGRRALIRDTREHSCWLSAAHKAAWHRRGRRCFRVCGYRQHYSRLTIAISITCAGWINPSIIRYIGGRKILTAGSQGATWTTRQRVPKTLDSEQKFLLLFKRIGDQALWPLDSPPIVANSKRLSYIHVLDKQSRIYWNFYYTIFDL